MQCKHWPAGAVGEPVLRDLYGTLHHVAAQTACVVTTGSTAPAAREWARTSPSPSGTWQYPVANWPTEIAELAARTSAAALAASGIRPGWYVYVETGSTSVGPATADPRRGARACQRVSEFAA